MDNEVAVTFVFHAMGDDVREVVQRCLAYFDNTVPHSVDPLGMRIEVTPK